MTSSAQTPKFRLHIPPAEMGEELDRSTDRLLDRHAAPGFSLVVVREGETVLSRGSGHADAAAARPMTAQTRLEAASLAKPLTAYLALSLCAEGVLDPDSALVSYLPADCPPGLRPEDPRWAEITLRHVLSHTSGLSHSDPPVILTPPGERFRYSLGGFALLQRVLEQITGQNFAVLADERIFQPFGMTQSSFLSPQDLDDDEIADGHDAQGRPLPPTKTPRPRAWNSLWTSALDYGRFLARLLSDRDHRIESVRRAMSEPQVKIHDELSWTLGWGLQEGLSGPVFWHWGGPSGGRHYVAFSPDHGLGLVLLVNSAAGETLWPDVVDIAMGGHHPILPWGGSLWHRAERRRELAEVEKLQLRHESFAAALGRTLSEQSGIPLRVEASFTESAPYSECVLMAARFATCVVRLKLGSEKPDAALNLPVAVLRGLLGTTDPESLAQPPDEAERRRMESLAERIAGDLVAIWPEGSTYERVDLGSDPETAGIFDANETVLLLGFRVVLPETTSSTAQPAHLRYRLAFTVGYPLGRL